MTLTEKAPDSSTISVNCRRKFQDNDIAEKIFNEISRQAIEKGLIGGQILYTDSTHVKAKANKHKKQAVTVSITPKAFIKALDEQVDIDRKGLEKSPFDRDEGKDDPHTRTIQQSKTDLDSGQLHKEGKPDGFYYNKHRTVDSKNNLIVNVHVTPVNINDVDPLSEILTQIKTRIGYLPNYMGLDTGHHNAPVCVSSAYA
ncbi:hypothetical protein [Desulfosporosinus sp. SB140]|uniref:hypothetical protein n=1 Tax=Desulfosporosinus paludis TaxID=3115649 RepID=UPI003890778F